MGQTFTKDLTGPAAYDKSHLGKYKPGMGRPGEMLLGDYLFHLVKGLTVKPEEVTFMILYRCKEDEGRLHDLIDDDSEARGFSKEEQRKMLKAEVDDCLKVLAAESFSDGFTYDYSEPVSIPENERARVGQQVISEGGKVWLGERDEETAEALSLDIGLREHEKGHHFGEKKKPPKRFGWGGGGRDPTKAKNKYRRNRKTGAITKRKGEIGYLPGEVARGTVKEYYAMKAKQEEERAAAAATASGGRDVTAPGARKAPKKTAFQARMAQRAIDRNVTTVSFGGTQRNPVIGPGSPVAGKAMLQSAFDSK